MSTSTTAAIATTVTMATVNDFIKNVNLPTLKSKPFFVKDAEIKEADKRWNYKEMPVMLANLFSMAVAERDENDEVVLVDGHPVYTLALSDLDPQLAAWMHKNSENYRTPSHNDAFRYSKDMYNNKWERTSQSIIITPRMFNCVDGQHRNIGRIIAHLRGSDAKVPVRLEFAAYNPAVLDTGKKRTLSDFFHGNGVKNHSVMSAAMQQIWAHFTGKANKNSSKTQGTNSLIFDLLPTFQRTCDEMASTIIAHNKRNGGVKIGTPAKVAGLFTIFSMIDKEKSAKLMDYMHFASGVQVPSQFDSLASVMRRGDNAKSNDGACLNYRQLNAALITAWNHINGETLTARAKWKDTKNNYPQVFGIRKLALDLAFGKGGEAVKVMLSDLSSELFDKHVLMHDIVTGNNGELPICDVANKVGVTIKGARAILDELKAHKAIKVKVTKTKITTGKPVNVRQHTRSLPSKN